METKTRQKKSKQPHESGDVEPTQHSNQGAVSDEGYHSKTDEDDHSKSNDGSPSVGFQGTRPRHSPTPRAGLARARCEGPGPLT